MVAVTITVLAALVLVLAAIGLAAPAFAIPTPEPPPVQLPDLPWTWTANDLAGLLMAMLLAAAAELYRRWSAGRRAAELAVNLAAAVEPLVLTAETIGGEGVAKYARVYRQAQSWLDEQGITGQPRRLLEQDLPELIEEAVRHLPK